MTHDYGDPVISVTVWRGPRSALAALLGLSPAHLAALLKKRGFVRPEIVVWTDGAARNLSLDPEAAKVTYRVEITGTDALSDEVKGVIAATGEVYELSRVGSQLFVVGAFDDRAVADRLAESIRQTDAALEVKVAEIAE